MKKKLMNNWSLKLLSLAFAFFTIANIGPRALQHLDLYDLRDSGGI